jgi:hypothetical protein
MEVIAVAGMFVALAVVAAIPLVLLLNFVGRHPGGKS